MKIYISILFFFIILFPVSGQNIPIDFEEPGNGADWTWTTFENESNPALEIVPNPDISGLNTSATVAKFTALQAGQPFAGCESFHGAGIGTFTIDASNSTIRIMVWKSVISDVGIKLVREDNWSLGEIKKANTRLNEWEQIEFDFSEHIGNTYDQIVIFPDFEVREADNVIYFDEVYGEVATTTSIHDLKTLDLKLFPNPAYNNLTVQFDEIIEHYKIYSLSGELLAFEKTSGHITTINIAHLSKGMYLLEATNNQQTIIEKFSKN